MKQSGHFDLRGLLAAASAVVFENERHLVTFVERTQARAFERSHVHKDILRTVSGSDEPEALCTVEKLYCSSNPHNHSSLFVACEKAGQMGSRMALATQVRVRHLAGEAASVLTKREGSAHHGSHRPPQYGLLRE